MKSKDKLGIFKSTGLLLLLLLIINCKKDSHKNNAVNQIDENKMLFESITPEVSGIDFVNILKETIEANYFTYMYLYIGGGVAVGDINNDGLVDVYFTSNTSPDKLYLNKGDMKFEDITEKSGINDNSGFNTGVTIADVNNDGFLDIYVSRGGWKDEDNKFANLLYINNGNLSFTEKAEEFGLDDSNRTIQTTFFDYDNDNDLDAYVSNAPMEASIIKTNLELDYFYNNPRTLSAKGSDRLYENNGNGHFTDVSEKAGLVYDLGHGLNPMVADLNGDQWLDIYVSNDFDAPDLVYINNGDKTFTESGAKMFKHMSLNSMGSDVADINNDGFPDLMTLDMNPQDYIRSKTTMGMTPLSEFEDMVRNGYYYQYMHNMLQLNNGNGTFSEIGNLSGIANTDWSWSLLLADFDLDGYNDVYVTNGIYRDVINRDKNATINKKWTQNRQEPTLLEKLKYTKMLPQQKMTNYLYKNNGNLTFEDVSKKWVDSEPTYSNGSTYADLDNDGDLDIVINNINEPATILKNNAVEINKGKYLKAQFKGPKTNPFGVGVKAKLAFNDSTSLIRQLVNTRGFLSSVSNILHFGFGNDKKLANIQITWPDGKTQIIDSIKPNQALVINYINASQQPNIKEDIKQLFVKKGVLSKHIDPYFNDFDLQILLPNKLSQTAPFTTKADVNNDGFIDIYIGGGKNQPGQLLMGSNDGTFKEKKN
ncbi:CRTAC1 family protein [Zobellia nedashkovskayae]